MACIADKSRSRRARAFTNLFWLYIETSYISECQINRKREIQYVLAFLRSQGQREVIKPLRPQRYNKNLIYANKSEKSSGGVAPKSGQQGESGQGESGQGESGR